MFSTCQEMCWMFCQQTFKLSLKQNKPLLSFWLTPIFKDWDGRTSFTQTIFDAGKFYILYIYTLTMKQKKYSWRDDVDLTCSFTYWPLLVSWMKREKGLINWMPLFGGQECGWVELVWNSCPWKRAASCHRFALVKPRGTFSWKLSSMV